MCMPSGADPGTSHHHHITLWYGEWGDRSMTKQVWRGGAVGEGHLWMRGWVEGGELYLYSSSIHTQASYRSCLHSTKVSGFYQGLISWTTFARGLQIIYLIYPHREARPCPSRLAAAPLVLESMQHF